MRGLHKSKRVSWASDSDIFQVRLFLSEESPSQVGLSAQDELQAKKSLLLHGAGSDGILPPGFEGNHPSSQLQIKLSQIPVIGWTNPPKILLNLTWQVVAGEESRETEDQNKREMRELEAIYPRPSSIPPNPTVSVDVEDSHYSDNQTALIPIMPEEDEDAAADPSYDPMAPLDASMGSQPPSLPSGIPKGSNSPATVQLPHDVQSDLSAASAALTHGNLIDHELLNKILSSPEVIEMLVRDYGTVNNFQGAANARSSTQSVAFSASPKDQVVLDPSQSLPPSSASPVTAVGAPPTKDFNYYKSSLQPHGGERQGTLQYSNNCYVQEPVLNRETAHNSGSGEQKPKIMKPCIYFNSSRGCRNGANCAYQHDAASQPRDSAELPGSKRMKLDSEISS